MRFEMQPVSTPPQTEQKSTIRTAYSSYVNFEEIVARLRPAEPFRIDRTKLSAQIQMDVPTPTRTCYVILVGEIEPGTGTILIGKEHLNSMMRIGELPTWD